MSILSLVHKLIHLWFHQCKTINLDLMKNLHLNKICQPIGLDFFRWCLIDDWYIDSYWSPRLIWFVKVVHKPEATHRSRIESPFTITSESKSLGVPNVSNRALSSLDSRLNSSLKVDVSMDVRREVT